MTIQLLLYDYFEIYAALAIQRYCAWRWRVFSTWRWNQANWTGTAIGEKQPTAANIWVGAHPHRTTEWRHHSCNAKCKVRMDTCMSLNLHLRTYLHKIDLSVIILVIHVVIVMSEKARGCCLCYWVHVQVTSDLRNLSNFTSIIWIRQLQKCKKQFASTVILFTGWCTGVTATCHAWMKLWWLASALCSL